MTPSKRREQIASLVKKRELGVDELAKKFAVTGSTIRRDLAKLASDGQVIRTFSGAAAVKNEDDYPARRIKFASQKHAIAMAASEFVRSGMTVFLDAGSTCTALAEQLSGMNDLLVVTPSLSVARALYSKQGIEAELLGGHVRSISDACYGSPGLRQLDRYAFDFTFNSADELSLQRGLREESHEQIELKSAVLQRSECSVILADHSKISSIPKSGLWVSIPKGAWVVSDAEPPEEIKMRRDINWKRVTV